MASFTKLYHRHSYSAISPALETNSAKGRTVLITGGSDGIGYAIARSFVAAKASRVVILGRREAVLHNAVQRLQQSFPDSETECVGRSCDITSFEAQDALWAWIDAQGFSIDVLVLNAASTSGGFLREDLDRILKPFQFNVFGNMRMAQRFLAQEKQGGPKSLLNISSFMAHSNPAPKQGTYSASKAAFANLLQHLAEEVPAEEVQIMNIHPGAIFTSAAKGAGFTEQSLPWDSENVPGHFCVWAATEAARFLHGRFLWANWDVDELQRRKGEFDDPGLLKMGLQGAEYVDISKIFGIITANEQKDGHASEV